MSSNYYYSELIAKIKKDKIGDKERFMSSFNWGKKHQFFITMFLKESKFLEDSIEEIDDFKNKQYLRLLSAKLNEKMIKEYFLNHIIIEYTNEKGQRVIYSGGFTFEKSTFQRENGSSYYMKNNWTDDYMCIVPIKNGRLGNNFLEIPREQFFNMFSCLQNREKKNLSEPQIC